ncbi:MAG: hypothetical protein QME51_08070 [Planctomycetota bacterium]|nr:hypothetical protein [Planctomycetota bacterium]
MENEGSTEQASQRVNQTKALFPELLPADESNTLPAEDAEAAKSQASESGKTVSPPQTHEYLDIQDFGEKKVKVKIDGIEAEIPFKDVVKGYQTEQYLTRKGQTLAEERKRLQEAAVSPPAIHSDDEYIDPLMAQEVKSLKRDLEAMKEINRAITSDIMPLRYERNVNMIDNEMKAEGLTDFKEKLPEIESMIKAMPPEKIETYDTIDGFKALYKSLKLQELVKKQASTTDKQNKQNAADVRPNPRVVPIESGSSPSGGATTTNAERAKAFALASKSGNWVSYLEKYG